MLQITSLDVASSQELVSYQPGAYFSFKGAVLSLAKGIIAEQKNNPSTSLENRSVTSIASSMKRMSSILAHTLLNDSHKDPAERVLLKKIDQLTKLLGKLDISSQREKALKYLKKMDADLVDLLCEGVCYAHGWSRADLPIAKGCIERNPEILLQVETMEGDSLIKKLIFELEEIGKNKQCSIFLQEVQRRMHNWGPGMKIIPTLEFRFVHVLGNGSELLSSLFCDIFSTLADTLPSLNLTEEERIELAHCFIENKYAVLLAKKLEKFQLSEQERIKIAFLFWERGWFGALVANINELSLPEHIVTELTKALLEKAPESVCCYFESFRLSEEQKIRLARTLVEKKQVEALTFQIHKFKLPQDVLQEVSWGCLRVDPLRVAWRIKNFPPFPEQERITLAYAHANNSVWTFINSIENYDLSEAARFDLAQHCAMRESKYLNDVGSNIDKFDLNVEHRSLIAWTLVLEKPRLLAECIPKFKIDEKTRAGLALEYARKKPYEFSEKIQNFNLDDSHLTEAVCIYFEANTYKLEDILSKIQLSENGRLALALTCVRCDVGHLPNHLQLFNLNQESRQTLARAVLEKDPKFMGTHIHQFQITDETVRVELLYSYVSAVKDGREELRNLTYNIKNFQVTDVKVLIAISEECIAEPEQLMCYYSNCNFDQVTLVGLLKKLALRQPVLLSSKIAQFNIANEDDRIEIAKICFNADFVALSSALKFESADQLGYAIVRNIDDFKISSQAQRVALIQPCFAAIDSLPTYQHYSRRDSLDHLTDVVMAYNAQHKMPFVELIDEVCKIEDLQMREKQLFWLTSTLSELRAKLSDEQLAWVKEQKLLNKISNLPIPELRLPFSNILAQVAAQCDISTYNLKTQGDRSALLSLLHFSFLQQKIPSSLLDLLWKRFNVKYFIQETPHFRTLVQTLLILNREKDLSSQEKTGVLVQLSEEAVIRVQSKKGTVKVQEDNHSLLLSLYAIIAILEFKESKMLKQPDGSFSSILKAIFNKHIPIGDISDFALKYSNTFGASRNPEGIMIYAGKMKESGSEYLDALADFVRAVLTGEYPACRYDTMNNPHLRKIAPEAIRKWQISESISISQEQQQEKDSEISLSQQLKSSLQNGHLPFAHFSHLQSWFQDSSEENRTALLQKIITELEKKGPDHQFLEIEKECLLLIDPQSNRPEWLRGLKCLKDLLSTIARERPELKYEFLNDVNGLLRRFSQSKKGMSEPLVAIDTDDFDDIFNCGKEVDGSCQRWDGDPNYCCGLIGLLNNGQNRLLAVKNNEGRICSRVIMRLLLDEENKPVIFLERPYPMHAPDTHVQTLLQLAKMKAEKMGLSLTLSVQWKNQEQKYYPTALSSLGGPAPAEYSDAVGQICDYGKFKIQEVLHFESDPVKI